MKKEINNEVLEVDVSVDCIQVEEKTSDITLASEQVEADLGGLNLGYAEEEARQREKEKEAEPIVEERVAEAIKVHNKRLKREAAELIYEHDTNILNKVEKTRIEDRKQRKRKRRWSKIKSLIWGCLLLFVIFIFITNNEVRELLDVVFTGLVEMFKSLLNGDSTSSNEVVNETLSRMGEIINSMRTSVTIVD